ncbi:AhpC/TSA family protein [Psychroflexus sp. YR1-1]|uniref:thioredoxin-dependent peroxiredoxin n=1 Tax=Psychroflexus aurantiacus TaxID=2709310 RepID=A0A6B3R1K0_9FLAO|nr:peroxiredoxin-like family protein [Psychroflexus aurantiacus]NEV93320.1 AhpC/TSA family protein [Psychroflexus aurantiacus]
MKTPFFFLSLLLCLSACKQNSVQDASEEVKTNPLVTQPRSLKQFGISDTNQPKGLNTGDKAPELLMTTSAGEQMSLASLYKDQPLVIIFYRGYWCPSCSRYLSKFSERSDELKATGARLLAVTPETYENIETTKNETGLNVTVVSDTDGSVMKAFDVLFEVTEEYQEMIQTNLNASISETNTSQKAILPVPATYILNTQGEIIYKHFNPDYNQRASVDDILKNLPKK